MSNDKLKRIYRAAALRLYKSLPLEHFAQTVKQSNQRTVTVSSFGMMKASRPDIQLFSELLLQYHRDGFPPSQPGQVCPDCMVVVYPKTIEAKWSYDIPLQPVLPLMVMDHIAKESKRKDYDDNHRRYERDLKIPYYFLFDTDIPDLKIFQLVDDRYVSLIPDFVGRFFIPELDLGMGLLNGEVRYWLRGQLMLKTLEFFQSSKRIEIYIENAEKTESFCAPSVVSLLMSAEVEIELLKNDLAALKAKTIT